MNEHSRTKRRDSRSRWSRRSPSYSRSRSRSRSVDHHRRKRDSRDRSNRDDRRGRSRSRSRYRKNEGCSKSADMTDHKLPCSTTSASISAPQQSSRPALMTSAEEDEVAWITAQNIQRHAQQEVETYLQSSDYQHFLEHLKRRERERILFEVQQELSKEKEILLQTERQKLQAMVDKELSAERIKVENQLKLEQHQNAQYLQRLQQDEERLQRVQQRMLIEKEVEAQRQPSAPIAAVDHTEPMKGTSKLSFALAKKKGLF